MAETIRTGKKPGERQDVFREEDRLEALSALLPLFADLTGMDLFIDVPEDGGATMKVAAQAGPTDLPSSYRTSVVGCEATREKEAAVYRAAETGLPVRDLRAVTQEDRDVLQSAVPVRGADGSVKAVLIGERDVSEDLRMRRRYEALERQAEEQRTAAGGGPGAAPGLMLSGREAHHRIKNQLQLLTSIMNLELRRLSDSAAAEVLRQHMSRVFSLASMNEQLAYGGESEVRLKPFVEKLAGEMEALFCPDRRIRITVGGSDSLIERNRAVDIALVVNELLTNALKYAFEGRESGEVRITLSEGELFSSVTVSDNGRGYAADAGRGVGSTLIGMLVRDKLNGRLYSSSDESGTSITFDYPAARSR